MRDHGITYPVALDPDYGTWEAWGNQYWPAKYFVDRAGHVRYAHFGEGDYEQSESVIRTLLAEDGNGRLVSGDDRRRDAERAPDAGELPRLRTPRPLRGLADRSPTARPSTRSRSASRSTASPTAAAGRSRRSGSSPARTRGSASTSSRATSSSCSERRGRRDGRGRRSTAGGPARSRVTRGRPLHAGAPPGPRRATTCSTSPSRREPRPTPSRSASPAVPGRLVLAASLLVLPEEAGQLGRERVARRGRRAPRRARPGASRARGRTPPSPRPGRPPR